MTDDNNNTTGSKDNTDLPYKPTDAQHDENAPRGHLGTDSVSTPGLGPGGFSPSNDVTASYEQSQPTQTLTSQGQVEQDTDQRAVFVETGDAEVDAFYAQDNRMITQDAAQDAEFGSLIQSKYAEMTDGTDIGDTSISDKGDEGI